MKPKHEERVVLWVRCVPGRDSSESSSAQWVEKTITRAHISGARVQLTVGNTALITFDGIELEEAVELARNTVEETAQTDPSASVHVGLALGDVESGDELEQPVCVGAALDRAQTLSHRARGGEIVFDESAEQRAEELFLFAREIVAERVRGYVLDPVYWNKRECRQALKRLKPAPIPRSAWTTFESLREIAAQQAQQRVALHCDAPAAAIDLLDRLLVTLDPPLHFRVGRNAGALRPLGSLALALRRLWPEPGQSAESPAPSWARDVLQAVVLGVGVQRREVVSALTALLRSYASERGRPCIVLEQLHEIDPATLGVVAEALMMTPALDALVVMTLPIGTSVPAQLVPVDNLHVLTLPALPAEDRSAIAEAVLSLEPAAEIAQRVAMLGGDSALSVMEAVRTLVSSGDLVIRGERFAWRLGPRQGASAVPVEALITERVVGLMPTPYRVLETICVSPRDTPREFIERVALRDGVTADEFASGLAALMDESFVDDALSLAGADAAVRGALRNIMPPARAAELHRFVADLLREALPGACFGSGELAYHLLEGGQNNEAALALVDAAHAASDGGFQRVALRLLATAVEWDGSAPIRKAASELARSVGALSLAPSRPVAADDDYEELKSEDLEAPAGMAQAAMRSALHAFATRDYEAVERWLDAAIAAGGGRAAAQRVLAMSHLARGERENALRTLQRAGGSDPPAEVRARETLSWALLHLANGDPQLAVRDALAALSQTRQLNDSRGETAALHVMALCYRMLERSSEANQLETAAARLAAPTASAN